LHSAGILAYQLPWLLRVRINPMRYLIVIIILITAWTVLAQEEEMDEKTTRQSALSPLAVCSNGHFLIREDGTPFFWLGDTGWFLSTRSPEEVRLYMEDRAAKGFNVIQMMAIRTSMRTRELTKNYRGDLPFDDLNPVQFNENYWQHLDFIVDEAARNGLYIALFSMWGRDVDSLFPDPDRNNYLYTSTLAQRYRDRSHVLFAVCGEYEKIRDDWETDSQITDPMRDQIRRLAQGMDDHRERHNLMTIHPILTSSRDFHSDSWLDFNMQQTWGHIIPDIKRIREDFHRVPTKPVLNGEPGYENRPQGDCPAWHLRLEGYWSVFSGAFGFTYGAHKVWRFEPGWEEALDYQGAGQMRHLRALMDSRPCLDRIPDPDIVTSDPGSMSKENPTYCVATRAQDGSFLFVYTPRGNGFQVDMTKLSGTQVHGWWYSPRDGLCYDAEGRPTDRPFGSYPVQATRQFSPPGPSGEGRDWVLILEDSTKAKKDLPEVY
jgi:hypothetical protein